MSSTSNRRGDRGDVSLSSEQAAVTAPTPLVGVAGVAATACDFISENVGEIVRRDSRGGRFSESTRDGETVPSSRGEGMFMAVCCSGKGNSLVCSESDLVSETCVLSMTICAWTLSSFARTGPCLMMCTSGIFGSSGFVSVTCSTVVTLSSTCGSSRSTVLSILFRLGDISATARPSIFSRHLLKLLANLYGPKGWHSASTFDDL